MDTNILVALVNKNHSHHKKALKIFDRVLQKEFVAVISSQNLLELSAVLVHGFRIDREEVKKDIARFASDSLIEVVYPDFTVMERFFKLMPQEINLHLIDLYLLATALVFRIDVLITADSDFKKIKSNDIQVFDPFPEN